MNMRRRECVFRGRSALCDSLCGDEWARLLASLRRRFGLGCICGTHRLLSSMQTANRNIKLLSDPEDAGSRSARYGIWPLLHSPGVLR